MLLLTTIITAVVQLTSANDDFLNNCPIDATQRVGNDRVIDVLNTFYKDLTDLRAIQQCGWIKKDDRFTEEHTIGALQVLRKVNSSNMHVDRDYGIKKSPNLP